MFRAFPSGRGEPSQGSSVRDAFGEAGLALVTLRSVNSSDWYFGHARNASRRASNSSVSDVICDLDA